MIIILKLINENIKKWLVLLIKTMTYPKINKIYKNDWFNNKMPSNNNNHPYLNLKFFQMIVF